MTDSKTALGGPSYWLQRNVTDRLFEANKLLKEAQALTHEYNAKNNVPNYRTIDFVVPIGTAIANIDIAVKDIVVNGIAVE